MKVLLVNGSPHQEGNTNAALLEIARQLEKEGIGTEVLWLGMDAVSGCRSCYACGNLGKCVINDFVNTFLDKAAETDGFIFGSPVHFGSASGALTRSTLTAQKSLAASQRMKPPSLCVHSIRLISGCARWPRCTPMRPAMYSSSRAAFSSGSSSSSS